MRRHDIFSPARCSWRITTSSVPANARYRSQNWLYCSPSGWDALYSCHSSARVTPLRRSSQWTLLQSGNGRRVPLPAPEPETAGARARHRRATPATANQDRAPRHGGCTRPPSRATPSRFGQSLERSSPRRGTAAEPLVSCASGTTSASPPWPLPQKPGRVPQMVSCPASLSSRSQDPHSVPVRTEKVIGSEPESPSSFPRNR